ncbi:MAG: hypothetical protein Q8S94_07860 [Pseudohongiella sp.]|nr:hypothetical protein [Pseudohongiella sp.]
MTSIRSIIWSLKNKLTSILTLNLKDTTSLLHKCDVLFFCHDVDRGVDLNGKAYSPLIDSVRDDFESRGFACITIAHPWSVMVGVKAHGSPIAINGGYFIDRLITKIFRVNSKRIANRYRNVFHKVFSITEAKLIITVGCSDTLCEEARLANCFHVELLHGIGYTFIPWGWGEKATKHLPQAIATLDDISAGSFSPLNKLGVEVKTVPHPFWRRFNLRNSNNLPMEWSLANLESSKFKKQILVSLQWAYAGDHGEHTQFSNILNNGLFYEEIAEVIEYTKDIFWRFRLHPVQLRQKKYVKLRAFLDEFVKKNPNTEWRQSSVLPFPSLIAQCSGNISMSSMSCYDSAAMGVPSIMLCPTVQPGSIYENRFADLVREGYVLKSPVSVEGLKSWVCSTEKRSPRMAGLYEEDNWTDAVVWMLSKMSSSKYIA